MNCKERRRDTDRVGSRCDGRYLQSVRRRSALYGDIEVISEKYLGDAPARLRFLREARSAASVRHPNVASVFHLGKTGSSYFYAMEFVEGETLEKFIKRSGCLEVNVALEIVTQVAAGLAAVHKQKLVHRDIKPSNIMVSLEDGGAVTAKIIDLGLAKSLDESGYSNRNFNTWSLCWDPRISPALNSLQDSRLISARISIRLARRFGRC